MTGKRIGLALAAATFGLLSLAACGTNEAPAAAPQGDTVDVSPDLSTEGQALAAMGFDTLDVAGGALPAAAPSGSAAPSGAPSAGGKGKDPSARPGQRGEARRGRVLLRRNVLHGEAVVQTDEGPKTVAVQRGTVTEITDKSVTVKSTDGFTQTWTFGDPLRVVERRTTIKVGDVKAGTEVGVAGRKDGSTYVARLIVIPAPK